MYGSKGRVITGRDSLLVMRSYPQSSPCPHNSMHYIQLIIECVEGAVVLEIAPHTTTPKTDEITDSVHLFP